MRSFFIKNCILSFKAIFQWSAFLIKYRLPLSLRRNLTWSMDVKDFEGLINVLRGYRTGESVYLVELGAGVSTLVLGHLLPQLCNDGHLISIEGEESYAHQLRDQIKSYELDDVVSLHHVPYANGDDGCWFNKDSLRHILGDKRVDILLVDAPPGVLCPRARQPAIPFFLSYLKQNGTVLLHDAYRQDESDIAEEWSRYFNVRYRVETPRGFDVFEGRSDSAYEAFLSQ